MSVIAYKGIMPKIAPDVFIAPGAWVIGDVTIGGKSSIWFNTVVRGDVHYVRIGSGTAVQDNSTLHVTGPKYFLEIGDRVTIGHKAIVHGCVVEDDVMIGMGAVILDGARIGSGSIVAAGSLVTPGTVIPPNSMVMGSPARVKREVTQAERELIPHTWSHYVDLSAEYMQSDSVRMRVRGFLG